MNSKKIRKFLKVAFVGVLSTFLCAVCLLVFIAYAFGDGWISIKFMLGMPTYTDHTTQMSMEQIKECCPEQYEAILKSNEESRLLDIESKRKAKEDHENYLRLRAKEKEEMKRIEKMRDDIERERTLKNIKNKFEEIFGG